MELEQCVPGFPLMMLILLKRIKDKDETESRQELL